MFSKYDDSDLRKEILDLKLELEKLKTHINSLRGLINRKQEILLDSKDSETEKETTISEDGLDVFRI